MKSIVVLLCFGALCSANVVASQGHPIEKVINLLKGLKAKATMEGKAEAVDYNKFVQWCSESLTALNDAITDEKERISELEDLIAGKTKEKETLETDIGTLEDEIGEMEAAATKAKGDREDENDVYTKVLSDAKATIAAVEAALSAVSGAEKTTEGFLLIQRSAKKVLALVNQRPKQLAEGDLDAHVDKYDFKSENVIELLKGLKKKFQDEKHAATVAETNALNAYNLAKNARDAALKAANGSKSKKETTLGKVKKTIADSNSEKDSQESDLKADSKGHEDTKAACAQKKGEWEERSSVRENELAAMDAAMGILAKAGGVRTEAPGNPIPPASPVAFLQLDKDSNPKMSAVLVLRAAAQKTHSHALERLSQEVAAHLSGPFDQMNNMIEKMIFRLMDEQKQEDEHKDWCDQELKKTNVMKDDKEDKVAELKAAIAKEVAAVAKLTAEITSATEMMSDIVAFKKEATEIREVGKKENKLAIDDAETGQKALANAIAVLQDFYKSTGEIKKEPWEFLQAPVKLPENPKTWDSSYSGVSDPKKGSTGIIVVLEAVMSDFAKMEAETKAQEAADQKEFDQSMSDNDIELARRTQESDMKTEEKKRRSDKIAELESQKKSTSGELEKTNQYLRDLKPACVNTDAGASYDDRKAARTQEVEALKKAQGILEDAFKAKASSFLQVRRQ